MDDTLDLKMSFSKYLSEVGDFGVKGMTDCETYGMMWGCDTDCPVLKQGKCKLTDTENKDLYNIVQGSKMIKEEINEAVEQYVNKKVFDDEFECLVQNGLLKK